jgi:iron complex outermembrane recepter protein
MGPTSWWQLKGSYSYLHLETEDKPGYTDTGTVALYNGSSPHDGIVIQSLFNLPKRFEYDMTYRYVSALPAQAVKAYSTADVRVGWHTGDFEFSLDGQNLFQPDHGEFGNTPGPVVGIRRTVYGKITWVHKTTLRNSLGGILDEAVTEKWRALGDDLGREYLLVLRRGEGER